MTWLFIVDPLEHLKEYKDSTVAMMREAARRGQVVHAGTPAELSFDSQDGLVRMQSHQLRITQEASPWYADEGLHDHPLNYYDAVLMRKDPPFDVEFLNATLLLSRAVAQGARVINDPQALRDHNEKLAVLEFPQYAVPTLVTRSMPSIRTFWAEHEDIVVKPIDGMGGTGVFRLRPGDLNAGSILEAVTQHGQYTVMAQRFIPEISEGDKRIVVIGGEPVPYCLARIPAPGETRGNLAAGGHGRAQPLTGHDEKLARVVGRALLPRGLMLLGLDVIGDHLTEINITSPTCFVEIEGQAGVNVAAMFLDELEKQAAQ
ncbi:MAG: glutathione synthase [Burkholderiaceae bacterium]